MQICFVSWNGTLAKFKPLFSAAQNWQNTLYSHPANVILDSFLTSTCYKSSDVFWTSFPSTSTVPSITQTAYLGTTQSPAQWSETSLQEGWRQRWAPQRDAELCLPLGTQTHIHRNTCWLTRAPGGKNSSQSWNRRMVWLKVHLTHYPVCNWGPRGGGQCWWVESDTSPQNLFLLSAVCGSWSILSQTQHSRI